MVTNPQTREQVQSSPAVSQDQLQMDVCAILLMEARKHNQLFDTALEMKAIGLEEVGISAFWDMNVSANDLNLDFSKVKDTEFAKAMMDHFDFGFHAITGTRSEPMEHETLHTWFGSYLLDLNLSAYVLESEEWGVPDLKDAVRRCLYTMELSNARRVLEGYEPFYHFCKFEKKDDDRATEGELTIRQMAMLAGMEEMSLRSIISRKSAPLLEIRKHDRRTIIDATVGCEWLKAKGRYLEVREGRRTAELDLMSMQFRDIMDLTSCLTDRLSVLCDRDTGAEEHVNAILMTHGRQNLNALVTSDFGNQELMTVLAKGLDLPPHWLVLRAAEAMLKTEIFLSTRELEDVKQRIKNAAAIVAPSPVAQKL